MIMGVTVTHPTPNPGTVPCLARFQGLPIQEDFSGLTSMQLWINKLLWRAQRRRNGIMEGHLRRWGRKRGVINVSISFCAFLAEVWNCSESDWDWQRAGRKRHKKCDGMKSFSWSKSPFLDILERLLGNNCPRCMPSFSHSLIPNEWYPETNISR